MTRTRASGAKWTWRRCAWLATCLPALLSLPLLLRAQEMSFVQQGFEGRAPLWVPGASDASYKETAHRLTEEFAHGGHRSEYIELQAQQGSYVYYTYPVGRAPVSEDMLAAVWVKANRPGIQLLARLVLPHERDPRNAGQPLTTLLRGDAYQTTGSWQHLELRQPLRLTQEQQQLLRAELRRDVTVADAYVDLVLLNVFGGPGLSRVWIDDLEVGPILDPKKSQSEPDTPPPDRPVARSRPDAPVRRAAEVKVQGEKLNVGGQNFFLRAIRHSGTPLKTLRDAGFNTIWVDEDTDPETVEQAVNLGFWLVPMLSVGDRGRPPVARGQAPGQLTSNQLVGRRMAPFLLQDAVLCWDLGGGLATEQYTSVTSTASAIRTVDPSRPLAADIWDGFRRYSSGIDQVMLGVHRWPLMTGLELTQYRDWLASRRTLAQSAQGSTFCWTWVQTHLPDWFTTQVYEKPSTVGFNEPVGPQPEQIRLLTYTALTAGYRGLGFWSDRFLADSHAGRDRLLQMALLNLELQMIEPLLVSARTPLWVNTSSPNVKAAVMRTDYGVLCLPVWVGKGSQFVPGQAAAGNLSIVVPQVPTATQAWLVSPGEVRTLRGERVVGGTKITIPEFGLTAAIVFTGDLSPTGLVVRFQDQVRSTSRLAAQWAYDLAQEEYAKVAKVEAELEDENKRLPDGGALLEDARRRIQLSANHRRNGNLVEAYAEAQRAVRPLRILMRAQWEEATKELDTPVASPYAVSFYTLPRHWHFRDELMRSRASQNVLPGGDFELPPQQRSKDWLVQDEPPLDEVTLSARRVADKPHDGKQALLLEIKPKDPKVRPVALERSFLAIHSPAVRLPAGTLVRVSGWVRIPGTIAASADGALLYDSAGGEPLAVRLHGPIAKWKKFTLYRRVPASGSIHVTLALTGLGKVYFDDVRIEPLVPGVAGPTTPAPTGTDTRRVGLPSE
ncbi:MAG TPA: hypothetical protein VKD72_02590 [Gemmataceae bacterium]|nr:hypothetical protein [Gemmataceae bacterium]